MCRCQPISELTSKVYQTATPNMQRCSNVPYTCHELDTRISVALPCGASTLERLRLHELLQTKKGALPPLCSKCLINKALCPCRRNLRDPSVPAPDPSLASRCPRLDCALHVRWHRHWRLRPSPASIVAPICLDRSSPPNTGLRRSSFSEANLPARADVITSTPIPVGRPNWHLPLFSACGLSAACGEGSSQWPLHTSSDPAPFHVRV